MCGRDIGDACEYIEQVLLKDTWVKVWKKHIRMIK